MRSLDLADSAEAKAAIAARSRVPAAEHSFHEAAEARDPTNHASGQIPDLYESHQANARRAAPILFAVALERKRRLIAELVSKSWSGAVWQLVLVSRSDSESRWV